MPSSALHTIRSKSGGGGGRKMTRPQEGCKPRVCRRLFVQEADDEPPEIGDNRTNRFVEDLHERQMSDFIERYNFDPQTERPLPGNFEWYERKTRDGEWEKMPVQSGDPQLTGDEQQPTERETETEGMRPDDGELAEGDEGDEEQGRSQP